MTLDNLFDTLKAAHTGQDDFLDELKHLLRDYYEDDDAISWLKMRQPLLDGYIPSSMIVNGKAEEVLKVMQRLDSGAYI